jgi:hypothetical protein
MDRPPRVRRGAIAGLGAGVSLAAASLCILVLGAATVAFVPWGTPDADDRTSSARLHELPRPAAPAPALPFAAAAQPRVTPAEPATAPARGVRRRRPARPRPRPMRRVVPERSSAPVQAESGTPAPIRTAPPALAPAEVSAEAPERAPDSPVPVPVPPPVRDVVEDVTEHTRGIGETVGGVTARVGPDAAQLVQETTDTVASAVEGVTALLP